MPVTVMIRVEQPTQQLNEQIHEFVIPDATPFNDGVMTAAQAAQLTPSPWQGLNYQGNWGDIGHDNIVGQVRLLGDTVQFRGAAMSSQNQSAQNPIAILPAGFVPSVPRFVATAMENQNLNAAPTDFFLLIDSGVSFGVPGVVLAGPAYTTPQYVLLDGLSFSL